MELCIQALEEDPGPPVLLEVMGLWVQPVVRDCAQVSPVRKRLEGGPKVSREGLPDPVEVARGNRANIANDISPGTLEEHGRHPGDKRKQLGVP